MTINYCIVRILLHSCFLIWSRVREIWLERGRDGERVPSVSHIIRLLSAAAKTQINLWVKGRIL